tara:strand:- start:762 stop:4772 length:4011 start_codon:yes stop_codon:yes gene_type:complete
MGKKEEKENLKKATKNYKSADKKKAVGQALKQSKDVKSQKYMIAYDAKNNIMLEGGLSHISKTLKIDKKTLLKHLKDGSYKTSKSFQLFAFKTPTDMVRFKDKLLTTDIAGVKGKIPQKSIKTASEGYKIIKKQSTDNKFWGTKKNSFKIGIINNLTEDDIQTILDDVITKVKSGEGLKPTDKMRIILNDPYLNNPLSTKLVNVSDMSIELLYSELLKSVMSYDGFDFNSETEIIIESLVIPVGGAVNSKKHILKEEILKNKTAITCIDNSDDDLCMARALVLGIWRHEHYHKIIRPNKDKGIDKGNEYYYEWENIRRSNRNLQKEKAEELHADADVPIGVCGIPECQQFEAFLSDRDYQLTIFDLDDSCNRLYPDVDSEDYVPPFDLNNCIYLLKDGDHYHHLNHKFIAGLFDKHYFCHRCKTNYPHATQHKCKFKCPMCCSSTCDAIGIKFDDRLNIQCEKCLRFFPTSQCLDNHKIENKKGVSNCDKLWKCPVCRNRYCYKRFPQEGHIHNEYWCNNCFSKVPPDHKCYMMPKKIKDFSELYIFFDFETHIDYLKEGEVAHRVMYAVSQYFDSEEGDYIYHHNIEDWCKWALCDDHKKYTFIAHNGKGYDFQFILKWIITETSEVPHTINDGRKITYMTIDKLNIRFVDSLNFLTCRLADMPKMFGLTELRKGYYPHMFNTPENINYIGPMPPFEDFGADGYKEKDYKECCKWYQSKIDENYVWNNALEMKKYCESDVDILRRAMIEFRSLYIKIADIDPLRYLTIASVCMSIFRAEFLDADVFDEDGELLEAGFKRREEEMWGGASAEDKEEQKAITKEKVFKESKIAVYRNLEEMEWIRGSFFGGRTNALKLLYNFKNYEEGRYVDITSLYPTTQYYDDFPKGHYKIIEKADITNTHIEKIENGEIFGIIDCILTAPPDLYIPVLPRKAEKLIFDLLPQKGRWCHNELKLALDMGYKLIRVKRIMYWEECSNTLFRGYVEKFLKIKQEASGYPDWVFEDEDDLDVSIIETRKDKYVNDYYEKMGIRLDKDKIVYNEGLRQVAKLCLNSLWGKFGQRINLGEVKIVTNKAAFYKIIQDETNDDIKWIELDTTTEEGEIKQHKIQISWKKKDEYIMNDYSTNIGLATYTTANARVRLYEGLRYLNHQVLYFDTDSIIYVYDKTNSNKNKQLELGDNLGDWTDELGGKKMVGSFVSGGPKNYSYELSEMVKGEKFFTKVKGFKLSVSAKHNEYDDDEKLIRRGINHQEIIEEVKELYYYENKGLDNKDTSKIWMGGEYDLFIRTDEHDILNKIMKKKYSVVYDKRIVLYPDKRDNIDTLPFGHKDAPYIEDDSD